VAHLQPGRYPGPGKEWCVGEATRPSPASLSPLFPTLLDVPARLFAGFLQTTQEQLPVIVISEDGFLMIASTHQVINRPRILKANLSSHETITQWSSKSNVNSFIIGPTLYRPFTALAKAA